MKNERISIALVSALSLLSVNVARADEPPPADDTTTTTTTTTTTSPTTTNPTPEPGTVSPTYTAPQGAPCGPLSYSRTDKDYHPGRNLRIAGGLMIGLGLATAAVGAGVAAWGAAKDVGGDTTEHDKDVRVISGSVVAGIGGLSLIAGIPMVVEGVRQGRAAKERQFTLAPNFVVPKGGGAVAGLGGKF